MLNVLFFGQLKDVLKTQSLCLEFNAEINSVEKLRKHLQQRGALWQEYLAFGKALVAVEQELALEQTEVKAHYEVAFFPPVTGG